MKHTTNRVLMIAPTNFAFNEETSLTNAFQQHIEESTDEEIQVLARAEFDVFVTALRKNGVDVDVYDDQVDSLSPDSIFPNNWFSTHGTGELIIYPMAVLNRQLERRGDIIQMLVSNYAYSKHDLSHWEKQTPPSFLEGTGSIVFDHDNKIAYAALSPRTSLNVLDDIQIILGYEICAFEAFGANGELIYHTNVMMTVGSNFVAIGIDTISKKDRNKVIEMITKGKKELISLTNNQIYTSFAGNMLQVENLNGEKILVLSNRTMNSLSSEQQYRLTVLNDIVLPISIPTIEKIGGGSVRCMLAEIFTKN